MSALVDSVVSTGTAEVNGLALSYSIQGFGPPLVLLHGAEAGREMFTAFAAELAPHFTVIAPDQRDTGATQDRAEVARNYGLADLADDTAGLIQALGHDRAHVFGTSFGGHIAQVLALRHPERIDRLVLANTFLAGHALKSVNPEVAATLSVWRAEPQANKRRIAAYFFPDDFLLAHPGHADLFAGTRRTPAQVQRRSRVLGTPYPVAERAIVARTLVLASGDDRLVPEAAMRAVAGIVRAPQFEVLPGLGHIPAIQAPADLARAVVSFLRS